MSCSRTGTSMCSRCGRSRTVTWKPASPASSHCGIGAVERVEVVADDDHRPGLVAQGDDVALADRVAGDRDALAVDGDVAVADELAGLGPARAPAGAVGDVVEAELEHLQQVLAGDARAAVRLGVDAAELLLHEAVDAAGLLLLTELEQVLGALALAGAAGLAGRVGAPLDRALHGVALGALEEQLHALPAAEPADGSGVASHRSDPPPLGRAAAVVRARGSRP